MIQSRHNLGLVPPGFTEKRDYEYCALGSYRRAQSADLCSCARFFPWCLRQYESRIHGTRGRQYPRRSGRNRTQYPGKSLTHSYGTLLNPISSPIAAFLLYIFHSSRRWSIGSRSCHCLNICLLFSFFLSDFLRTHRTCVHPSPFSRHRVDTWGGLRISEDPPIYRVVSGYDHHHFLYCLWLCDWLWRGHWSHHRSLSLLGRSRYGRPFYCAYIIIGSLTDILESLSGRSISGKRVATEPNFLPSFTCTQKSSTGQESQHKLRISYACSWVPASSRSAMLGWDCPEPTRNKRALSFRIRILLLSFFLYHLASFTGPLFPSSIFSLFFCLFSTP